MNRDLIRLPHYDKHNEGREQRGRRGKEALFWETRHVLPIAAWCLLRSQSEKRR